MANSVRGVITDMAGQKHARLLVLAFACIRDHRAHWTCLCDCGQTVVVAGKKIRQGSTRSCGCLKREMATARHFVHGQTGSREHTAWMNMLTRCDCPDAEDYPYYKGRGIKICERWRVFLNFLADMGPCPDSWELDRIDVNGNYGPGNCRWASELVQSRNRRKYIATHGLEAVYA